jgi:hypothetical protein
LINETDSAEDWPQHEAYCQYVHATLTWLDQGCCEGVEVEEDLPCEDAATDYEDLEASQCSVR